MIDDSKNRLEHRKEQLAEKLQPHDISQPVLVSPGFTKP
jgi:hypothetical protein